ncbi:uncharacterized protein LOC135528967 [Oncorhynchus masou masou]|uniref:uncharacterized protein LOC135528967 n=1 Tax=Oncorhynchus masou masou TaxID=90313 RepID=UPI00318428B6
MNSNMNSMESLHSTLLPVPSRIIYGQDRQAQLCSVPDSKQVHLNHYSCSEGPRGKQRWRKPLQKSTLMLFINPSSPSSRETAIEKVGVERGGEERRARDRARRPASCYANVFGPVSETVTVKQAGPGNWSPETVTVTQAGPGNWSPETVKQAGPGNWSPETVTVKQAGPGNWSPETVTQAGPWNWSPETVKQAGPGNWSPETVKQAGPGNWSPETVTQAGPGNWSPETVKQAGPGNWSPETVKQAGPGNWSPETVTVTQAGPGNWSPETVILKQAGPGNWSPETVIVKQAGPGNWSPETVTVTQAGPGNWSPETVTVKQAGPGNWSPETVTVTQAGPGNWSPETVTVKQAGPGNWSMELPNQTQNSNIDPVRGWVKDTATSNSRLNTGYSSSSISAGPAGRDREMCPPETESSRPAGRDREMCPPETESSRPAGRDREMCPPETESSRPAGRDREMCPPETESSRPAGRDREMCPLETESSRPEGRGTEREGDGTHHSHQADARSSQPQPPAITLIKHQEPPSHQRSPEDVLALNAAVVIAHIKLQRQLSLRKTTPHDLSTQDSRSPTTPEGGKTLVKDAGGCVRPRTDDNRLDPGETTRTKHHTTQIDVGFIPLNSDSDPETSNANIPSPREALERSRPHFISRSQGRLREMERRAEERREERRSDHQPEEMMLMHHRGPSTRPSLSDNLFRPRDRAITGKEMQLRTRQNC